MHIFVAGNAAPQGSITAIAIKRKGVPTGKIGYKSDNPALGEWREAVRHEAEHELRRGAGLPPGAPLFGPGVPCAVEIRFYLARPAGHYGTGRNAGQIKPSYAEAWPMGGKRGDDWDKLARAVCDGLQAAGVVADDKQIVGTPGVWKVYADYCIPGADIWVEPAPPGIPALTLLPGARRPDFGMIDGRTLGNFVTGNPLLDDIRKADQKWQSD